MKSRDFPAVTIPPFDHAQISSVLEINKQIIDILKDSQNNAWNEDEQRIYVKRLWSNLTYLGTLADTLVMSSNIIPSSLKEVQDCDPPTNRKDLLAKLTPPTMIAVPDPNLDESSSYQVPPFAGNNPQQELKFYKLVDQETAMRLTIERNLDQK